MLRERRDDALALACLVALTLAMFAPAVAGAMWANRDFPRWLWPSRELWLQAVRAGAIPQWNPTIGLGVPTLAIPVHGTFYPAQLLLLIAPLGLVVSLHAAVASVGGYLLARSSGCRPSVAFLTGAVFGIGGYAVSMWGNGEKVLSGAWVPWSAYAIAMLTRAERLEWRRVAWAALPLALLATAGDPFLWLHAGALGVAAGNVQWKSVARTIPAFCLASLLAAPALVPAFALLGDSERATGLGAQAELWSMHPVRLLELVAPGALGNPGNMDEYPGAQFVGETVLGGTPWAVSMYCGAAIALFAPFARKKAALIIATLLFAYLASGKYGHIVVPLMRYPEKHFLVAVGSLALLASMGLERMLAEDIPLRGPALTWGLTAAFAGIAAPTTLRPHVLIGLAHGAVCAAMLLGAVFIARRRPRWSALLPAIVGADLFLAAIPLIEFTRPTAPPIVEVLRRSTSPYPPRVYRPRFSGGALETLPDNVGELYGIAHVPGHDAALPAKFHTLWQRLPGETAMSLFAIDWILLRGAAPATAMPVAMVGPLQLARWPTPRRVRLLNHVTIGDDKAAIVLDAAVVAAHPEARALHGEGFAGDCKFESYAANSLAMECNASQPSLMVLADGYARGWTATVDGAAATIHRADVVLRGVYLEPGRHRIEMRYRTPGLTAGLLAALLGVLITIVLFRVDNRR